MAERILFLTGHLAHARLEKLLNEAGGFGLDWSIVDIGVKVAALMTEAIITRRLRASGRGRPGRSCRAAAAPISSACPPSSACRSSAGRTSSRICRRYFGKRGRGLDLSRHDMRIFAEIVDASALGVDAIVARATAMRGSRRRRDRSRLPARHAVSAPRGRGARAEGGRLSGQRRFRRCRSNCGAAARPARIFCSASPNRPSTSRPDTAAVPVLVPATHGDMDSLLRAAEAAERRGIKAILDPVLDPIHFGFMTSLVALCRAAQQIARTRRS